MSAGRRGVRLGYAALAALALLATLTKAVHVDDAAHLFVAEHLARAPFRPLSGVVLWGAEPGPISALNQPPLLLYGLALARALDPTLALAHACVWAFGLAAMGALVRLAHPGLGASRALVACAFVFAGPAFLPSQNLMLDVPLLALVLLALVALAEPEGPGTQGRALAAGFAVGAACLVKYTALALLPILALDAWWRRAPRRLIALLPPLVMLAVWSAWNVLDVGAVHLLTRTPGSAGGLSLGAHALVTPVRGALFVLALGAVAPHTLGLVSTLSPRTRRRVALGTAASVALFAALAQALAARGGGVLDALRGEPLVVSVLRPLFFANGALAIGLAVRGLRASPSAQHRLLAAAALALAAFVVLFAPFIAVRHVLLVLPAVVVLGLAGGRPPTPRALGGALALGTLLGGWLAASDVRWAAVYRDEVARVRAEVAPEARVVVVGRWGLAWYAHEAGFEVYAPGTTRLRDGDLVVRAALPDPPPFAPDDAARLVPLTPRVVTAGPLDLVRTTTERGGFYALWQGLPWTLSAAPVERFERFRVR